MHPIVSTLLRAQTYTFRGRLAHKPECRYFESGAAVANAKMAVDLPDKKGRDDNRDPDWLKLEVWGQVEAGAFADALDKGQLIDVIGRVKTETWTDRNSGEERQQLVVRVQSWSPVGAPPAPAAAAFRPAARPAQPTVWNTGDTSDESDEIPF